MVFIYILQLEQGKYYVGKTTNPKMRLENHFDLTGSSWTKKYKPINIYAIIPDCDNYDEDKYTKIYMEKFGIDNVRGGSYCQIELNKEVKKIIEHGINASNDNCYHCSLSGHFANNCPNKKILVSETKQEASEIKIKINELSNKKIYNCNYCKKECPDKEYLMKHLSIYCKEKPEVLEIKTQMNELPNKKIYNCNYCKKECLDKEYLMKHLSMYCKAKLRIFSDNTTSSNDSYKIVNDNKNLNKYKLKKIL